MTHPLFHTGEINGVGRRSTETLQHVLTTILELPSALSHLSSLCVPRVSGARLLHLPNSANGDPLCV